MMDQLLAVRRNPNATFDDVADLIPAVLKLLAATFGPDIPRWPRSTWGPLAGVLDGVRKHPEFYAWARRRSIILTGIAVWLLLHIGGVKKRTGYNDFLLARWTILGDEETALELIERSKWADSIGCTLCWALASLARQYPEFEERFGGLIPKANPADMVKDAPAGVDKAQVLRRAEWIDAQRREV